MKHLFTLPIVCLATMATTSLSAQQTVPDNSADHSKQLSITKVKYQDEDELIDKSFNGLYYLNIGADSSIPITSSELYSSSIGDCRSPHSQSASFDVNLHLPDGHRIRGIRYYHSIHSNASSGSSSSVSLFRMNGQGQYTQLLKLTGSTITNGIEYITKLMTDTHYVNNADGFYSLRFSATGSGAFNSICSARLIMQATP